TAPPAPAPPARDTGYWLVARNGNVYASGDAAVLHSLGSGDLGAGESAVSLAAATYGDGYALAASDGGVFVFSDRPFHGSLGDHRPTPNARASAGWWKACATPGAGRSSSAPISSTWRPCSSECRWRSSRRWPSATAAPERSALSTPPPRSAP